MFRALADVHVAWTIFILCTPHEHINFGDLRCSSNGFFVSTTPSIYANSSCIPVLLFMIFILFFSAVLDNFHKRHPSIWLTDNSVQITPAPAQLDRLKTAYKNTSFWHIFFDCVYIRCGFEPRLMHM